ncbi:MAG: M14 family zinc carboxypeptidase [Bacteroidota bacterium]
MKCILSLFVILLLIPAAYPQKGWRDGEMEVKITINTPGEARLLYNLHLNGDIHSREGYATMYVIPPEFEKIKETGLRTEVIKNNLNEYYQHFWSDRSEQYHNYDQIIALMDSLATAFPDICQKTVFALTPQGRQLACLKISDNVFDEENEPEVFFDGGIHGDEIGGPENLIRFARQLCSGYGIDPEITGLVNSREIFIYPMVNPDGRANMSRYNSNMVDCNRDGGYMWNGEGNSPGAFSQLETRTLRNCLNNHRFVIHVTYHSGEEVVLYPWCYRAAHVPDYDAFIQLVSAYSSSSGYSNLQYRQSYADYPTNGETIDYSYGSNGAKALTMEISTNKQPPASQIQVYYQNNVPAMIEMIKNAGYGIEGTVTDSLTGQPVKATIFVNNFFPSYTDSTIGDYHKYLPAGNYIVKVVANNYRTKIINNITVTGQSSTVINVQMHASTGHYATKTAVVAIPGNNPMDEANTTAVIGAPDSIFYSIGKNGWIIADMQESVFNIQGDDFTVYEGDTIPEGYTCLVGQTIDGPWISLGTATGTKSFDLESTGLASIRLIKIVDDGDGLQKVADAGFDLDAIMAIEQTTGIEKTDKDACVLKAFPNPASSLLHVTYPGGLENVRLFNIAGQLQYEQSCGGKPNVTIDLKALSNGAYQLISTGTDNSRHYVFVMVQK